MGEREEKVIQNSQDSALDFLFYSTKVTGINFQRVRNISLQSYKNTCGVMTKFRSLNLFCLENFLNDTAGQCTSSLSKRYSAKVFDLCKCFKADRTFKANVHDSSSTTWKNSRMSFYDSGRLAIDLNNTDAKRWYVS